MDILLRKAFFFFKPFLPRDAQIFLRRRYISRKWTFYQNVWPIDERTKTPPAGWKGWPENKKFAIVLTHDVESEEGQRKCISLANLEASLGFRSSFNFIAEQYRMSRECQAYLQDKGFEIGLHGITHNGNPFRSRRIFEQQAVKINHYLREWKAVGFRCPSMYHNLEWILELDIEYDSSTFDTDPFEPQPDGVGTIFPFWVRKEAGDKAYLELPYTLPQDHTLFVIMREKTVRIWEKKLDWIYANGGMALLIAHPDYMDFQGDGSTIGGYSANLYAEFLGYVNSRYGGKYWNPLPKEVAWFWKKNEMSRPLQGKRLEAGS